jgi:hypothetical protein
LVRPVQSAGRAVIILIARALVLAGIVLFILIARAP